MDQAIPPCPSIDFFNTIAPLAVIPCSLHATLMIGRLIIVMLIALPVRASAANGECGSPIGAAVPNALTARAIALAVIAAHQKPGISKRYILEIERDGNQGWIAYQRMPPAWPWNSSFGSGGLEMHINRCSGAISEVYYEK
ncbi:hypothetical protein [Novosphingobium sp.]|uniref:hypothetical protein n=1 Tax=Novosphingobium sp. TaxID=1874826 RepID=UPI003B52118C